MDEEALERVADWLSAREALDPPLRANLIAGGRSNLTYRLTDAAAKRWVLRRPPTGSLHETAHDVEREAHVMRQLAGSSVPVPRVIGAEPGTLLGVPFFVAEHVAGDTLRTIDDTQHLSSTARRTVSENFIDTLAALHEVRLPAATDRSPSTRTYIERQLNVWRAQLDAIGENRVPLLLEVADALAERAPAQEQTTWTHGDYRLDNVLVGNDGSIRAVLDWELSTFGDPLADLALALLYWLERGDLVALEGAPTTAMGFASREQLRVRYEETTGRDTSDVLGIYRAFSTWKFAAILEGVYKRYVRGSYGEAAKRDTSWHRFEHIVPLLARDAADALEGS